MLISFIGSAQNKSDKPNVIFILADDLGYMDLGAYAKKVSGVPVISQFYETPNIDKMIKEGTAFTQAYANPLCSPTRASVITGKYASKLGFMTATAGSASTPYNRGEKPEPGFTEQNALWGDKIPYEQALINSYTNIVLPSGQPQDNGVNEVTLAEALKDYNSAFLGKWHLGGHGSEGYQPHDSGMVEIILSEGLYKSEIYLSISSMHLIRITFPPIKVRTFSNLSISFSLSGDLNFRSAGSSSFSG